MKKIYFLVITALFCSYSAFSQLYATSVVSCGASGVCLGGSSCDNAQNTVDMLDLGNFGTLSTGIGVACTRTMVLALPATQPNGSYAGFYINTGNVVTVLGNIAISTYNDNTLVETVSGASLTNMLNAAGKGILQFKSTAGAFNRIAIHLTAVLAIAQSVDVYYGFTNATLLPLQFGNVNYQRRQSDLLLQWTTQNEINTTQFAIEASTDGTAFTQAGTTAATGTGQYQYSLPLSDQVMYYRIKQVDNNGKYTYSHILVVRPVNNSFSAWVYPNPVTNNGLQLNVYSATTQPVSIHVTDQAGKLLQTLRVKLSAGNNVLAIDAKNLTPGMYLLRTLNEKKEVLGNCKFMKVN
ncbi:T9SS type A sorting domain-containing protein [Ferruginibacter sp.]